MEYIRLGADPYLKDFTEQGILHLAAFHGHTGIFVFFCSSLKLDINDCDINKYTPLHLAVLEGHENLSAYIIATSRNCHEFYDSKGYTALHLTAFSSSYKIARHLAMNGANRKALCFYGQTPAQLAVSRGATDMVKILVFFI